MGNARTPFVYFLNTFKYVSAHETILVNVNIEKEEYEYSTFSCRPYSLFAAFCLPVLTQKRW
nr:hypothetical protein [Escherichia coli O25b:H4-ST131]